MFHFSKQISTARQNAFTLVELLVVIAIIGILASLAAVGVMKSLEKAKFVAAKMEISQLEVAIAAAKQSFGNVDELPSVIRLYGNTAGFTDPIGIETKKFLIKAFGKAWFPSDPMVIVNCPWLGPGYTGTYPVTLSGMEALVFWLGGVRDATGFVGFSSYPAEPWGIYNPATPLITKHAKRKGPFYEFDASRITPTTIPTFVNGWGGLYHYFSKGNYPSGAVSNGTAFYNLKTFQIISSGHDQGFGSGSHTPGQGNYAIDTLGYDDIANFSSTQLGKKDE